MDSDECYCRKNAQGFAAIGIGLQVLYLRYRYGMVAKQAQNSSALYNPLDSDS